MFFRVSHWWDSEQLTFIALVTDTSKIMQEESQAPLLVGGAAPWSFRCHLRHMRVSPCRSLPLLFVQSTIGEAVFDYLEDECKKQNLIQEGM